MKKYQTMLVCMILCTKVTSAQPPVTKPAISDTRTFVRLNPLSATLKNEVTALKQGGYSVVSLQ